MTLPLRHDVVSDKNNTYVNLFFHRISLEPQSREILKKIDVSIVIVSQENPPCTSHFYSFKLFKIL